ncbi:MAG: PKD domain-containing protein [Chitinophagaceae bacterium]
MKKIIFIFLFSISCFASLADHLKGGWIKYEYISVGDIPNTTKYRITVNQYLDCHALDYLIDPDVFLGIFDGGNNNLQQVIVIPLSQDEIENKSTFNCIGSPPEVCYRINKYVLIIDLPDNNNGYILAVQRCCRIGEIVNVPLSLSTGITYANKIPGIINGVSYRNNSSAIFAQRDTALLCSNSLFSFDFSATDNDGDSLRYSFTTGYFGGDQGDAQPNPPSGPPFEQNAVLIYSSGYSGLSPMGPGVTIDAATGIISGITPSNLGTYVVAVVVNEYRKGILIGATRKELHIDVASCQSTVAALMSKYIMCDDFSLTFKNEGTPPAGSTYNWNFGDPATGANNFSSSPTPTHLYSDTGVFKINLKITVPGGCEDSASSLAYIYPGFFPAFTSNGQCKNTQIQFFDKTQTTYGVVDSWAWNFEDATSPSNISTLQNPQHLYSNSGNYNVSLTVGNSKGCIKTITKPVVIKDKPDLTVTSDTLICSIDTLQLNAIGNGNAFWTPDYNINIQNNVSPLVSPDTPTMYYVTLTDASGCKTFDSVFVDVKQSVTIEAGRDTGICAGDSYQLNPISDALQYQWSPVPFLDKGTIKNPIANPTVTTTFYVIGNIGKCQSTDSVKIKVSFYPPFAGISDTSICLGNSVQLNATGGIMYSWSPAIFLNNPNIPNPIAKPSRSIQYVVAILDSSGCLKPVFDTVVVRVEKVIADAGPRDTSIVINQPLQLKGTGGLLYLWSPARGLSDINIFNPIALLNDDITYVLTTSASSGCFATDTISVRVYKSAPGLYTPNAFTPNGDGLNDVFKPIGIGIKQINYFKIFDRWGQIIFSSTQ